MDEQLRRELQEGRRVGDEGVPAGRAPSLGIAAIWGGQGHMHMDVDVDACAYVHVHMHMHMHDCMCAYMGGTVCARGPQVERAPQTAPSPSHLRARGVGVCIGGAGGSMLQAVDMMASVCGRWPQGAGWGAAQDSYAGIWGQRITGRRCKGTMQLQLRVAGGTLGAGRLMEGSTD